MQCFYIEVVFWISCFMCPTEIVFQIAQIICIKEWRVVDSGIWFCSWLLTRFPLLIGPPSAIVDFLFCAFVIQRHFDKLRSCFSNAKFTNFGNSRNPRVTSSSIWAQVDCPAESWKRFLFFKAQPARADGLPLQNGDWQSFA